MMERNELDGGVVTYTFGSLAGLPLHAHVATRHGGVSPTPWDSLNFSVRRGDARENVLQNRRLLGRAAGFDAERLVWAEQVHGTGIAKVDGSAAGQLQPGCDGLVTDVVGLPLGLVFADCVPVLVYDTDRHVLGVVHAGWRGTVNGAVEALLWAMQAGYDCDPAAMVAAIGPSIGPASYTVGRDVYNLACAHLPNAQALFAWPNGADANPHFDLWRANAAQLVAGGVPAQHIEVGGIDTATHTDDFFSHRASGGRCGLFAMVAWLGSRGG